MKNQKETFRKMVRYLNNPDKEGGFWLPNIQRPFVWREDQIERLFDSILREYPIGTLLVWKTKSSIRRRKFIDNYKGSLKLTDFYVPEDSKPKQLVLDGQQRLQALYIGLCGSYDGRELYFNTLSGDIKEPDDIRYEFKFLEPTRASPPWFKFKEIVFSERNVRQLASQLVKQFGRDLTEAELQRIDDNVAATAKAFQTDEALVYQELDSLDRPELYSEEDVVEVFIRANAGGTRLGKSDLLFSLLISSWEEADEEMEDLLERLNAKGYDFDRDFVLKTCLTLLKKGARYEVEKFRDGKVRDEIQAHWDEIEAAILDVQDFLYGKTFVKCDKALPSYMALIPLIYLRFHYKAAWEAAQNVREYLLRTLLTAAFSGAPDQIIDESVACIERVKSFDINALFDVIRSKGKSLEITEDRLLNSGYGSDTAHLVFNLWYDFNYAPAWDGNVPHIDHIFPQSRLKKVKVPNEKGHLSLMKYKDAVRNQLANCMLLTADENGFARKSDTPPDVWFADKAAAYLELHLIPKDPALWKMEAFEDFIEARKKLILAKFSGLLQAHSRS